jgi:hypothetical protein
MKLFTMATITFQHNDDVARATNLIINPKIRAAIPLPVT